jgi:cytidyltransferase-like protein
MVEETKRPWGEYKVIGKTKIIKVNPNQKLSLQYHNNRDEFWKILEGNGKVIIKDKEYPARKGNSFNIMKKQKHRIIAGDKGIKFLEIATGEVNEEDITRLEDEYNRNSKRIVINSGYFDPLHVGHLECMELSKKLYDNVKLIVILNNDYQCKLKKGKAFMPQEEKKRILETLKYVDEVFVSIDKDKSVWKSIKAIAEKYKGNEIIFAKGGDRFSYEIPEAKICREFNIKIVDQLGKKIQSSSKLTGLKEKE